MRGADARVRRPPGRRGGGRGRPRARHRARGAHPAAPGQQVDVLGRIRATVLVADGMLSAFENVGRPDPAASPAVTAGGHGGELLRGGYAETAGRPGGRRAARRPAPARRAARSAELLRRLTTKHLGLIRRGPAAGLRRLARPVDAARSPATRCARSTTSTWSTGPAAGRRPPGRPTCCGSAWSSRCSTTGWCSPPAPSRSPTGSAARCRPRRPRRAVPPPWRTSRWRASRPRAPARPPSTGAASTASEIATFLRGYVLDQGASGGLFDVVSRAAAEKAAHPAARRTAPPSGPWPPSPA